MADLCSYAPRGKRSVRSQGSSRAGIALIVVLGFLTILILMAVALLTLTRTERLVSSYTSEGMRAKQLALGAIDRAMDDLNDYLDANRFARLPRQDAVFISLGTGGKVGPNTAMFRGEHKKWLPQLYWYNPPSTYNVSNIWENDVEWVPVRDPTNLNTGTILGRYAYVIVDCTGLLDVNTLGADTVSAGVYNPKPIRTSTRDIGLEYLPEAVGDAAALNNNRGLYHAFLTFQEALRFNDGNSPGNWPAGTEEKVFDSDGLWSVGPFSLSYDNGKWWDTNDWRWEQGMAGAVPNVNQWTEGQAAAVFRQLFGVGSDIALQMARALMDYRDADRIPQDPKSLTVEAVPMLNEFIFSGSVSFDGVNAQLHVEIKPETWYPFPSRKPLEGYGFQDGHPTVGATPGAGDITLIVRKGNTLINYGVISPQNSGVIGPISNDGNPQAWPPLVYDIPLSGVTNNNTIQIAARIEHIELYNGADLVDEVIGPIILVSPFFVTVPDHGSVQLETASRGVDDPRLNHISGRWQREPGSGTPGATNRSALGAGVDTEGASMFVRDGDLESVAELGFISIGEPWKTIPLYTPGGADLLNRFRTFDPLGQPPIWTNGLVNPNTHFSNVFDAVFGGVDLAEVPRTAEEPNLPPTNAWANAGQIRALRDSLVDWLSSRQCFGSADWVSVPAMQEGGALAVAGLNNNQREAIIRNSYRAFSANGNLYTVFVLAQTFGSGNTNEITAERGLTALIWHDPFPDEITGRRRWFIRWLNWMQ